VGAWRILKTKYTLDIMGTFVNSQKHGGMGFKYFASYNVAMLGKQGYKFQLDRNSLVTRLFKVRHFLNSDFIGSRIRSNPGYVWRSIFSAKNGSEKGCKMVC